MLNYQLLFNYVANEILFIFCLETGGLSPVGWKWIGFDVDQNVNSLRGLDSVSKLLDWVLKIGPTDNSDLYRYIHSAPRAHVSRQFRRNLRNKQRLRE